MQYNTIKEVPKGYEWKGEIYNTLKQAEQAMREYNIKKEQAMRERIHDKIVKDNDINKDWADTHLIIG